MDEKHEIALWSAIAAGLASLLAVGILDTLNESHWFDYLGALITAIVTGGSIYAKQRYEDAKEQKERYKKEYEELKAQGGRSDVGK